MRKISIIGSGGAGKSTFAKQLGNILNIPVYHLDSMYWKAGWVETEREDWSSLQRSLCAQPEWIMDGNYGGTMDIRLDASDVVVFLDLNKYLCIYRALKRFIMYYGVSRPDMAVGCNEKLDLKFVKWIYDYPKSKRPGILKKLETLGSTTKVYILRSPKEIQMFLEQLGNS